VAVAVVCDVLLQVPGAHEPTDELPAVGKLEHEVDLGAGHHRRHPCYGCTTSAKGAATRGHGAAAVTSHACCITSFDLIPFSAARGSQPLES
jgi:hypothetical protein